MTYEEFCKYLDKLYERCLYSKHNLGEFGLVVKLHYLRNFINDLKEEVSLHQQLTLKLE